jgi:hypothetical protein
MSCDGFAAEVYDLFVLGALDGEERLALEHHIADGCDTCLLLVKRSLSTWSDFAIATAEGERSPDLRSRIIRMAELSKSIPVLSQPSRPSGGEVRIASSWFVRAVAASITLIVGSAAWYAGRQSAEFDASHVMANLERIQSDSAKTRGDLDATRKQKKELETSIASLKNGSIAGDQVKLKQRVQQLEAEISQLDAELKREGQAKGANAMITAALATPGVRLVPLKGVQSAAHSIAYSLVTENGRVVLVASGLAVPPVDRRYQLWLLRKEDPKVSDGGIFSVEADGKAVFEAYNAAVTTGLTGIAVTEEPQAGSPQPTTTPILTGSIEASQQ